ncbi:PTS IIA-like nitrogen-regulatory protein PtsN [hydrothermal vent metagenome]|uniref:PTS IIA-like nitrogen-regulatory protein PtsN n=1 Tax=hydrothermal vent metagenome TaxID=652676 RepID=A0A3B0XYK0_9ZZZZ
MQITTLLDLGRIACQQGSSSKKRTLDLVSRLLADALPDYSDGELFDSLVHRERLGSTGLGQGVALPHGRLNGLSTPLAALVTLSDGGVDFDAVDGQPVDLLFALLVPEESTDEHLQILARLAAMFSDSEFCQSLRACTSAQQCLDQVSHWDIRQSLSA